MKVSLYQIEQEYQQIADDLIESGGEASEEIEQMLAITQEQLQNKAVCYAMVVKDIEAENEVLANEIKRLQSLVKSRTNTIDKLKSNLSRAMQLFGVEEIKTPLVKINFRKSEAVEVDDIIDARFVKTTVTTAPDKLAIKEAIKSGVEVAGARIVVNQNIQIK